jgi:hypothetical protein
VIVVSDDSGGDSGTSGVVSVLSGDNGGCGVVSVVSGDCSKI